MSLDACAKRVADGDPDRFASAMCAPMPQRGALMALYAFNVEVTRAPWVTQEPMIAEMRLQWWKDAIEEIYSGKDIRAHEVVGPLSEAIHSADLPRALFDALIEARRFDIYKDPHGSEAELKAYLTATAGHLMELAGRVLGAEDGSALRAFGTASGLARLFLGARQLYDLGHQPLPLGAAVGAGPPGEELGAEQLEAVRALALWGQKEIAAARAARLPRNLRPALLAGWQTRTVLRRAAQRPRDVLEGLSGAPEMFRPAVLGTFSALGLLAYP